LQNCAAYLFAVGILAAFIYRRIAAGLAIAASLLPLPLYIYFIFPGAFRKIIKGEYSMPNQMGFVWDKWAMAGILILAVTIYVSIRSLIHTPTLQEVDSPGS
jgi:hypothetical protein